MRAGGLRHLVVRLGLDGMHQVRELHRVLDEEDRHVVAHQVPVALVGVELHREAAHVAGGVLRSALAGHRGKAHEHRRDLAGFLERRGLGELGERFVALEKAVRPRSARVHDTLGNAFVVEVRDLLAQHEIFEQRRPAQAEFQRILVVGDGDALVGRERAARRIDAHAIQRFDGRVHAFRGHAAGLVGPVFLRQGATGRQARLGLGRRAGLGFGGVRKAVLSGLGGVVRHLGGERLDLRHLLGGPVVHAPLDAAWTAVGVAGG